MEIQTVTQTLSDKYSIQLMALQQEFIKQFADFKEMEEQFDLLTSPFSCDIETTTEELQIELIDLQSDNSLKKRLSSMLFCPR